MSGGGGGGFRTDGLRGRREAEGRALAAEEGLRLFTAKVVRACVRACVRVRTLPPLIA